MQKTSKNVYVVLCVPSIHTYMIYSELYGCNLSEGYSAGYVYVTYIPRLTVGSYMYSLRTYIHDNVLHVIPVTRAHLSC